MVLGPLQCVPRVMTKEEREDLGITPHTAASDDRKLGTSASTFTDAWIINNNKIIVATRGTPHSPRVGRESQ